MTATIWTVFEDFSTDMRSIFLEIFSRPKWIFSQRFSQGISEQPTWTFCKDISKDTFIFQGHILIYSH